MCMYRIEIWFCSTRRKRPYAVNHLHGHALPSAALLDIRRNWATKSPMSCGFGGLKAGILLSLFSLKETFLRILQFKSRPKWSKIGTEMHRNRDICTNLFNLEKYRRCNCLLATLGFSQFNLVPRVASKDFSGEKLKRIEVVLVSAAQLRSKSYCFSIARIT